MEPSACVTTTEEFPSKATNAHVQTFDYKNALLVKPVKKPETESLDGSPQKLQSTPKSSQMKPKTKQQIDRMLNEVGGAFLFLCEKCFIGKPPRMKSKSSKGDFCDSPNRHPWDPNKVMVHRSPEKTFPLLIRKRPEALHQNMRAKMCPYKFNCKYDKDCRCAHSRIEVKVWNLGNVSHDDIVKRCAVDNPPTGFCCSYCNRVFQVKWELENHANTPEHKANLTLDKERPWMHREPPDNVINGDYALCPR